MKKRFYNRVIILALLILIPALAICKGGSKIDKEFKKSIKIERSIKRTSFPAKSYNIEDFGAVRRARISRLILQLIRLLICVARKAEVQ